MFLSHTCLLFFVFALACGSSAFLLNEHANASVSHPDNCNYNIYSKIDALERTLHNLETTVREKTAQMDTLESTVREKITHSDTLMRQVLLTVTEMEAKIESSNMSLEIEEIKQNVKNIAGKPCNVIQFSVYITVNGGGGLFLSINNLFYL